MALIIELDLDMVQANLRVKFLVRTSNGSVVRVLTDRQTDRQTGPILLPRPLTQEVKIVLSVLGSLAICVLASCFMRTMILLKVLSAFKIKYIELMLIAKHEHSKSIEIGVRSQLSTKSQLVGYISMWRMIVWKW